MFLHLGNGFSVRTKDILAIQSSEVFRDGPGKEMLDRRMADGRVVNALYPEDEKAEVKALILTAHKIYLSAISPLTLKRRSELAFQSTVPFRESGR